MSDWHPIDTVPPEVMHIEGSFDGQNFMGDFSRREPAGPWYGYSDHPGVEPATDTLRYWRLSPRRGED